MQGNCAEACSAGPENLAEIQIAQLQEKVAGLEAELAAAQDKVNAATAIKDDFVRNMMHEFRTPLATVMGFAESLLCTQEDAEVRSKLKYINDSAEGLLGNVTGIIQTAKVSNGSLTIHRSKFGLRDLLTDCVKQFSGAAALKGLSLHQELSANLPASAESDASRIRQVLTILLDNAVKFTNQGTVTLRAEMADTSKLRIEVEDTGTGIAAKDRQRIFELFSQADASTTRQHNGLGLGLAMAEQLTKMLGGTLELARSDESGSLFTVELPLQTPESDGKLLDRESNALLFAQDNLPNLEILVVDDDRLCRLIMSDRLSSFGDCDHAVDGEQAVEMIAAKMATGKGYDLVTLDIMMPGMDGHEVLKHLREQEQAKGWPPDQHAKVIMTTSLRESTHCIQSFREGCEAYITKPVRAKELEQRLCEIGVLSATAT